jgi:glycosyltransferase involved in cell wall biosynthesis
MSTINVLWVIDHVCYDGSLHGGGRLYWNVVPRFDSSRFQIIPCMLRANGTIRNLFANSPAPVRILDKAKFDPTTIWTFLQLLRDEKIDVMHLHCYGASTFGRIAGLITGIPAIIHDYDTEVYFPYPWYLKVADRLLAPSTRTAIAASPMVKQFLLTKRKIPPERIKMMFHAIPGEKYVPASVEKHEEIRRSLQVNEQRKIIGTITKLGPQRGNGYLISAAAAALKIVPELLFLIFLKPTYFHRVPNQGYVQLSKDQTHAQAMDLQAKAQALGISRNIRLIEWPENIDTWISACDVIVAPFLSERFSSVHLLEAMAMGKPVIATDLGEQREIITNGADGYLVAPGDVKEMSEAIVKLLSNRGAMDEMRRCARVTAEQYSTGAFVENLQQLYTKLAESHPRKQVEKNWSGVRDSRSLG